MFKYPSFSDIDEHKDKLWGSLVQYYMGVIPFENVENNLRCLLGVAALYTHNNLRKIDLEKAKRDIAITRVTNEKEL